MAPLIDLPWCIVGSLQLYATPSSRRAPPLNVIEHVSLVVRRIRTLRQVVVMLICI
jgi:hypothetical protein